MSLSGSETPEDGLYGSWVELEELIAAVSRRESLTGPQDSVSTALQGELERILLEAQLECERSRDSPPQAVTPQSTGSPRPTSEHDSDCVTIQEEGERRVDTDWVWDWSSRPENMPPKEFVFQHPKQQSSLSVRKTEVMKRGIFSSDVLLILVPSLLASHLLTLGVGYSTVNCKGYYYKVDALKNRRSQSVTDHVKDLHRKAIGRFHNQYAVMAAVRQCPHLLNSLANKVKVHPL